MTKGLFISVEGSDGSGKSTQLENIKKYYENKGVTILATREPGGTKISEKLRTILLDKANTEMSPVTEMMIYAASRAQLVEEVIKPALERGEVVICDRFIDSSIAYQGYGRGLGDMVESVNLYAVGGVMPDLTIFLDLDPELGRQRVKSRYGQEQMDRLEQEKMDFHYRVYEGYKALAKAYPDRIVSIDASRSIEEMRDDIYAKLDKLK